MNRTRLIAAAALAALLLPPAAGAKIASAQAVRSAPDALSVSWSSPNPVDVYESPRPDASLKDARAVAHASTAGQVTTKTLRVKLKGQAPTG